MACRGTSKSGGDGHLAEKPVLFKTLHEALPTSRTWALPSFQPTLLLTTAGTWAPVLSGNRSHVGPSQNLFTPPSGPVRSPSVLPVFPKHPLPTIPPPSPSCCKHGGETMVAAPRQRQNRGLKGEQKSAAKHAWAPEGQGRAQPPGGERPSLLPGSFVPVLPTGRGRHQPGKEIFASK